jgi:maltose alpha-D-glucosyltransferase/alpha-amylase
MGANRQDPLGRGRLAFSCTALFAEFADALDEESRTPALEQSNTAVFFGSKLFLKGYRRLRVGVNPELELGRFLTEVSRFPHISPVLGAVEYFDEGCEEPATLAILQKFVENQGDLWTLICQHLSRLITMRAASPEPAAQAPSPESAAADFHLARMGLLGRRIAELHRALCVTTGDPRFDPEPVTPQDFAGWKASIERELDATMDLIESTVASLPEAARQDVAPVLAARERIRDRVRGTAARLDGVVKTRYHGDLHLGQVLVAQDDFVIVDFEGEPGRSLEERRAKSSPLRDVAGMLRSFSYAAHAALLRREPGAATPEAGAKALADWERDAAHHFLEGYMKAAQGLASVPSDEASFRATVELFLLEKALYELRYEIANRPDWVAIPARGLLELASQ